MYDLSLAENEVNILRWSLQVATDALALQENHTDKEHLAAIVGAIQSLDEKVVSQVKPQRSKLLASFDESKYTQIELNI